MRRTWLLLSLCMSLAFTLVLVGVPALAPPGAAAMEPTFSDVPFTHPHYEAIEGMAAAKVINGFPTPPPR